MGRATSKPHILTSLFAATLLLVRHRARRDAALLAMIAVLVALAAVLAGTAPKLVAESVDAGAREAIDEAGSRADVLVLALVGNPTGPVPAASPDEYFEIADGLATTLPPSLRGVLGETTATVLSPSIRADLELRGVDEVSVRFGVVSDIESLVMIEGDFSGAVVSRAAAEQAELAIGDAVVLADVDEPVVMSGIVTPRDDVVDASGEAIGAWQDVPGVWEPRRVRNQGGRVSLSFTALTSPENLVALQTQLITPWDGTIRARLDPSKFTDELRGAVVEEIGGLKANADILVPGSPSSVRVNSGFDDALEGFSARARAAVAQMSLLLAGALAAALCAVVLAGRLFVLRREAELRLERARGASLASVSLRVFFESLAAALVGGAIAVLLVGFDPAIVVVCAIAALGPVIQSALQARAAWGGRRAPANRADRLDAARQARTRRLVIEASIVVLAAASLWSVRSRGLLQSRSDGIDPLLSSAPVLLALAVCVVVLRVQPLVARALGRATGRGAAGLIAVAHGRRSVSIVPLLSLTMTVALAVSGGLLVDTVREGQELAAWQRVGADVRVDGEVSAADVERVRSSVTAASFTVDASADVTDDSSQALAAVLAVDDHYGDVVAAQPGSPDTSVFEQLRDRSSTGPLPVLVDSLLAERLDSEAVVVTFRDEPVEAQIVGTFDAGPNGFLDGPFLYVDLEALSSRLADPISATTVLANGPNSAEAVSTLDGELTTRVGWLADRQGEALVAGVNRLMLLSVGAAAVFALVGLLASVIAGSRARGRSLALLRTLGFRRRVGYWLLASELGPVVAAGLIGGILAGVTIVLVLGPSLGLWSLAGGVDPPPLSLSPLVILAVVAATLAACALAAVVEFLVHRTNRLTDILRVGESL